MNDKFTHLTRALSFALLFGWAGANMVSAQETQPQTQADEAAGAPLGPLPWLYILVEGNREAAEALRASSLDLVFTGSASGQPVLVTGQIDLPLALVDGDGDASMQVDRYPMVLMVDYERDQTSRLDREITASLLRKANSEDVPVVEPLSWRTFDLRSDAEATPVWVVLIKRSQYCPLVDVADVPDCEGFDVSSANSTEPPNNNADAEAATEEVVRPRARGEVDTSGADREDSAVLEAEPTPEPVDYTVTISLAFAGSMESTYGRAARNLSDYCAIVFTLSGEAEAVVADVDYRAPRPVINATLQALPDASIDLTGVSLRFDRRAEEAIDCAYNGAVVALDGMQQDQTTIAGGVVLPAQKPRFDLIYDLSGNVIGDDARRSGDAVLGFATLVTNVLDARLTRESYRYGALEDYFAWRPRNSPDPKLEPMSALDMDGSAKPSGTQNIYALNEAVRTQMLNRIEESVGGIRSSEIAALLDQSGESFATLNDAGDLRARDPNLRVLVQVANTARGACLDASLVEAAPNADIRQTTVKRIVAVAEPRLSFDAELTEGTRDSLIWRCTPTEGSLVETWLVPLTDVARDNDWQALTDQIGNLNRKLVP
jgi:hypothetical protein